MPDNPQLAAFIDQLSSAVASGNVQNIQEAIREYNLTYANNVAQLYGQNFGPGNPAPIGASTTAAGQAVGAIGYIPGFTGPATGQTQGELAQQASTAQNAAGLTGFYSAPGQSQWTPGTFLRMDPGTYDYGQYGDQLDYVLPTGQLQRVSLPQARAMGWNGDLGGMNTVGMAQAVQLERAPPPQTLPQQTLQGLTAYSNLNSAAQNQALAQAGVTGMYQAPATVQPPGTDLQGNKFSDLPQATQQAYYQREGSDWNAAMNAWTNESNANIRQWAAANNVPLPGGAGTPTETLQAQQQYFNQANQLAQTFGQYYAPGAPGQPGGAPTPGQQTQAAINQWNQIAQNWAQQYGYTPQFDANGQPIFQGTTAGSFVRKANNEVGLVGPDGMVTSFTQLTPEQQARLAPDWSNARLVSDAQFDNAVAGRTGQATPFAPPTTLAAQQQTYAQQLGAINAAAALQANPFRQQQVIGQLGRVLQGQGVAGFSAPNTVSGVGTAGGTGPNTGFAYMSQLIDDIRGGPNSTNSQSVQGVLDAIPTPNKINSADFLRSAPSTQSMILQGMQEKYGLDPQDSLAQIKNTLPAFTAPASFGQIKG